LKQKLKYAKIIITLTQSFLLTERPMKYLFIIFSRAGVSLPGCFAEETWIKE